MSILITGANRGIGRKLFDLYAGAGLPVCGTTRGESNDTDFISLDVANPASVASLPERLRDRPVSLLVCNAGVYLDRGDQVESGFGPDIWAESFAVNVTGVFLTIQALLPKLEAAPDAKIAIIASQMGSTTRAPGGSYAYRASKAAAINLGRNLAADLKPRGIAVGVYHPGWVRTDMGGAAADISVDEAAQGLKERFESLSLASTGCFLTWDGRDHPY